MKSSNHSTRLLHENMKNVLHLFHHHDHTFSKRKEEKNDNNLEYDVFDYFDTSNLAQVEIEPLFIAGDHLPALTTFPVVGRGGRGSTTDPSH